MTQERFKPGVTVGAIIERDGRFLLVEEHTRAGLRLNNPAGHLEPAEDLLQGCAREVLEETAFDFVPTALLGVYLTSYPQHDEALHGDLPAAQAARPAGIACMRAIDEIGIASCQ